MDIREKVREFVAQNFYVSAGAKLRDEDSLLDSGLVDSTGVLEVIFFIESSFGITVDDSETLPENLDSVARIAGYIERKRAALS